MKRMIYTLFAAMALASIGSASDVFVLQNGKPVLKAGQPEAKKAEVKKPAEAAKPLCICGDSCNKCKPGDCPGKCPLAAKKLGMTEAYAKVAAGEKVVMYLGVAAPEGAHTSPSIPGYTDGIYDCYLTKDGRHEMQIRAVARTVCSNGKCYSPGVVQASGTQYFLPGSSCANGQCPKQR